MSTWRRHRAHRNSRASSIAPPGGEGWTIRDYRAILRSEPYASADLGAASDVTAKSVQSEAASASSPSPISPQLTSDVIAAARDAPAPWADSMVQAGNNDTSQAGTPGRFRAGALQSVQSVHMACSPNNCASTQPPTGGDGEAPPRLGRDTGDESERSDGGDAGEGEPRREPASARRRWMRSEHRSGVVVGPRILGVRVLGEDDERARIVRPVAEGVKVERAPKRPRRRGCLHPREGVSVTHTPPAVHAGLHRARGIASVERGRPSEFQYQSSAFQGWLKSTEFVENTPASHAWAAANLPDVISKRTVYWEKWQQKSASDRAERTLYPDDGL